MERPRKAGAGSSGSSRIESRQLSGVELATSDAHEGLKQALQEAFPGLIWQRCQAHFRRNVLDQVPAASKDRMHEILDRLLKADSQQQALGRFDTLREEIGEKAPSALEVLEEGLVDATAVLSLPGKYHQRLQTTNMLERFIQEIRRREKVVRIFPNIEAAYRLVGALCAETHEEWSTGRRYMIMDEFFEWKKAQSAEDPSDDDAGIAAEQTTRPAAVPA